jgi:hypothetical protein
VNARGEYVAVRWQPATLFREFGPWVYAPDGTPVRGVLPGPDTTGYYTPLPGGDYALVRPKSRSFTLALFDARAGTITDVDSGVAGVAAQRVPGARALSYVRIDSADGRHELRRLDLAARRAAALAPALPGRTAHAWAGRGTILMARGSALYARRVGRDTAWRPVATFDHPELRQASVAAVGPGGDVAILASPRRPALATRARDSLAAGRSAAEVAAMAAAWQQAGRLDEYDVSEAGVAGPRGAAAPPRARRRRGGAGRDGGGAVPGLAPRRRAAGDARRAAGDGAGALAAYRRALELNPRTSDADRAAAAAVESQGRAARRERAGRASGGRHPRHTSDAGRPS